MAYSVFYNYMNSLFSYAFCTSHRQRRLLLKKLNRKRKRREAALLHEKTGNLRLTSFVLSIALNVLLTYCKNVPSILSNSI